MNYCLFVSKDLVDTKYINDCEELMIDYNVADPTLPEFLAVHQNQRLIIRFKSATYQEKDKVQAAVKHLAAIRDTLNLKPLDLCIEFEYWDWFDEILDTYSFRDHFFFANRVNDLDVMLSLLQLKPTDMYITDSLGFEIAQVFSYLSERNTKIRIYSNVYQTSSNWQLKEENPEQLLKGFFVRPEDVKFFDRYVDTIEFWGPANRQKTYYEIYAKDGFWFGPVNQVIIGYPGDLDSRCIPDDWGFVRSKCGRRCLKGERCTLCAKIASLAATMKDNDMIFSYDLPKINYEDKRVTIEPQTDN